MKRRRITAVILSFILALSLSVTTFATDVPQSQKDQSVGTEQTVEDETNDLEEGGNEEAVTTPESEDSSQNDEILGGV